MERFIGESPRMPLAPEKLHLRPALRMDPRDWQTPRGSGVVSRREEISAASREIPKAFNRSLDFADVPTAH